MAREKVEEKTDALAELSAMDITPAWILPGDLGTENISPEHCKIPRLSIAQPGSPQLIKNDPQYIPGLANGDAFNNLTGEIFGDGPIEVIVIRADTPRWMEFDEDRKLIDREVKAGDPRTLWTSDPVSRKRIPPIATQFFDYIVLKLPKLEPMALSFKSTGIDTATTLNGLIKSKKVPIFSIRYQLTPKGFSNDQGNWTNFIVKQLGWTSPEMYKRADQAFADFKKTEVEFEGTNDTEAVPSTSEL